MLIRATLKQRPSLGIRLLHALGKEPEWSAMTPADLTAFAEMQNRKRGSPLAPVVTGFPDRGATIGWQKVRLSDRTVRVRVHTPSRRSAGASIRRDGLPLVVHV